MKQFDNGCDLKLPLDGKVTGSNPFKVLAIALSASVGALNKSLVKDHFAVLIGELVVVFTVVRLW